MQVLWKHCSPWAASAKHCSVSAGKEGGNSCYLQAAKTFQALHFPLAFLPLRPQYSRKCLFQGNWIHLISWFLAFRMHGNHPGSFKKYKYSDPIQRDSDWLSRMGSSHFAFVFVFLMWEPLIKAIILSHHQRTGQGINYRRFKSLSPQGGERWTKRCLFPPFWKRLCISSLIMAELSGVTQRFGLTTAWGKLTCLVNQMNPSSDFIMYPIWFSETLTHYFFTLHCGRFLVRMKSSCSLDGTRISPCWFPERGGQESGCELI